VAVKISGGNMGSKLTWNVKILPKIVEKSFSVDSVLKQLDLKLTGGNRETVKRYINSMNLDTSHFTGQGHRKGIVGQPLYIGMTLDEIMIRDSTYTNTHRLKLRMIKEGLRDHKCEKCGLNEWVGKPIPLELHHKNDIRNDHRNKNIELICPNCHALTDNYRAKNIDIKYRSA
jgi:predicted nucleic-acid-binding Zn-ribbon protein